MLPFVALIPLFDLIPLSALARAAPQAATGGDCVGTISSLDDVGAAVQCKTVNINSFTVPAARTFSLDLLQGTSVHVLGDIQFATANWDGPLFEIKGENVTFDGNGKVWDGGGPSYWDGEGTNGGITKPHPMMRIFISGEISNVHVLNSPAHAVSIDNSGPIVVRDFNIDNSQGKLANDKSDGRPAGRNTDGFDVSGDDVVIERSTVRNQDDCLAINRGKNILFRDNYCEDGHGISIGSISSDTVVEDVTISGNAVRDSKQAFRIKTHRDAANSRVTRVNYFNNTAKGCTDYGVIITQSYPDSEGTPGNGVTISDVNFASGTTEVEVKNNAATVAIICGDKSCTGNWNWSDLKVSGGKTGRIENSPSIIGISL